MRIGFVIVLILLGVFAIVKRNFLIEKISDVVFVQKAVNEVVPVEKEYEDLHVETGEKVITIATNPVSVDKEVVTSSSTVGWKYFLNDKYHFEFKYPSEWRIERNSEFTNPETGTTALTIDFYKDSNKVLEIQTQKRESINGVTPETMKAAGASRQYTPYSKIDGTTSVKSNCAVTQSYDCTTINFQKGESFFNVTAINLQKQDIDTLLSTFRISDVIESNSNLVPVKTPDGKTVYLHPLTWRRASELAQQCKVESMIQAFAGNFIKLKGESSTYILSDSTIDFGYMSRLSARNEEKCGFKFTVSIE